MKEIEDIKETRKSIIEEYSGNDIPKTNVDKIVEDTNLWQKVVVSEIINETDDAKSFILVPDKNSGNNHLEPFKAGQYISLQLQIGGNKTTRAYSLSSSPNEALKGFYRITIKRVEDGLVSNYMLDKVLVGDKFLISMPTGNFGYNAITDEENVIGIAGGSGITPFISLAKAINEGSSNCNLTVIYSVKYERDIILKRDIDELKKCPKLKFVITLTREKKEEYLNGHISKEMIEPYMKEFNTFLMCGPKAIYKTMNEILLDFNVPRKCVKYENFFSDYTPTDINTYHLRVITKGEIKVVPCKSNETLLVAMESAGIKAPSLCRVGECGFCRSILVDGKIKMVGASMPRSLGENDYIHPCVTYPESDIVIRLDI